MFALIDLIGKQGRVFKNTKNLREHLKTHAEHGDDLVISSTHHDAADQRANGAHSAEHLEKFDDSDDEDPQDPSYRPEIIRDLKRKRMDSISAPAAEVNEVKKLRRSTSDLAKEFACREEGCTKRFKTVGIASQPLTVIFGLQWSFSPFRNAR